MATRVNRAQQNLNLPVEVVETLRNLSSYRKFKNSDSATMADIVNEALRDYFKAHKAEIDKAKSLLDDDAENPPEKKVGDGDD